MSSLERCIDCDDVTGNAGRGEDSLYLETGDESGPYCADCYHRKNHFPGCHKVHIECANKAIEEIRQILIKQDAENQMDDWMHKLHPVYSWLERWRVKRDTL